MELLRVGKRLEQQGTGIFIDLWPLVLSFCGRGWFEVEEEQAEGEGGEAEVEEMQQDDEMEDTDEAERKMPAIGPQEDMEDVEDLSNETMDDA